MTVQEPVPPPPRRLQPTPPRLPASTRWTTRTPRTGKRPIRRRRRRLRRNTRLYPPRPPRPQQQVVVAAAANLPTSSSSSSVVHRRSSSAVRWSWSCATTSSWSTRSCPTRRRPTNNIPRQTKRLRRPRSRRRRPWRRRTTWSSLRVLCKSGNPYSITSSSNIITTTIINSSRNVSNYLESLQWVQYSSGELNFLGHFVLEEAIRSL